MRPLALLLVGLLASLAGAEETPSVAALIRRLESDSRQERIEAARQLEALGPATAEAAPALVAALKDRPTRTPARRALVRIGPAAAPALFAALKKPETPEPQRAALRKVLVELAPRVLPKLIEAARGHDSKLRNDVIDVLAQIDPPPAEAFPVLVQIFLRTECKIVVPAAPSADEGAVQEVVFGEDEIVIEADPHQSSFWAAYALAKFGPKAIPVFLEALENDRWQVPFFVTQLPGLGRQLLFDGWGRHVLRDPRGVQQFAKKQIPGFLHEWRDPRRHTRLLVPFSAGDFRVASPVHK